MLKRFLKYRGSLNELVDTFILIRYFENLYGVLEMQTFLINTLSINPSNTIVSEWKTQKQQLDSPPLDIRKEPEYTLSSTKKWWRYYSQNDAARKHDLWLGQIVWVITQSRELFQSVFGFSWVSTEILPTKYAFTYDCKKDVKFHFRRVVIYWCKWFRKKWLLCMELSVTQNNSLLCRIHLPFCFGSETPVVLICTNMNI